MIRTDKNLKNGRLIKSDLAESVNRVPVSFEVLAQLALLLRLLIGSVVFSAIRLPILPFLASIDFRLEELDELFFEMRKLSLELSFHLFFQNFL